MSILKITTERLISHEDLKEAISLKCANCYAAMKFANVLGGSKTDAWYLCHAYTLKQLLDEANSLGLDLSDVRSAVDNTAKPHSVHSLVQMAIGMLYIQNIILLLALCHCLIVKRLVVRNFGFCPTGFHIARYSDYIWKATPESELHKYPEANWHWLRVDRHERDYEDCPEWESELKVHETEHALYSGNIKYDLRLGFVMGCVWGDDSSWKLERLDLAEAHKGILKREASFGYLELPALPLKECLRISGNEKSFNVAITTVKHFCMRDGVIKGEED
jgi:hypothetical protein